MMRSCAVIFIWRGVIRSEHETSILHTCSILWIIDFSFCRGWKQRFFCLLQKSHLYNGVCLFYSWGYNSPLRAIFHEGSVFAHVWTQGWEKEPFSICVSSSYAYKTIWEWAQQSQSREGWQFDVTSLIFVPLASIVLPCIQCCITLQSVLGSISRKLHRKKETKGGCPRS